MDLEKFKQDQEERQLKSTIKCVKNGWLGKINKEPPFISEERVKEMMEVRERVFKYLAENPDQGELVEAI